MQRTFPYLVGLVALVVGCQPVDPFVGVCGDLPLDECLAQFNLDFPIDGIQDQEEEEGARQVVSDTAQMCATGDGRVYALWIDDRRNFRDVWFNKSSDGGRTWDLQPTQITSGSGNASNASMSCAGDRIYVVWEDTRDSETDYENIYLDYSTDGGQTWLDEDLTLDDDPEGRSISLGPKVVFRGQYVRVVWFDQFDGAPDIFVATSDNGGRTFGKPVRVSGTEDEPGAYWSGNPVAAIDEGGRVHIVWEDTRNGTQDIFYTSSNASSDVFERQVRITVGAERGSSYGFKPSLALDGDTLCITWHDTRAGDARDIYMNCSLDGGTTWYEEADRVETDAPGAFESFNSQILLSNGEGHIVWQDNRSGGYDIYYRKWTTQGWPLGDDGQPVAEVRLDRDDPGAGNSVNPIITKVEGTIVVAWEDLRAGGNTGLNDLYYNYIVTDGENADWADEDFRLDSVQGGTKFTEDLSVAVVGNDVVALWVDNRDGNGDKDIYASHSELGVGVDTLEKILAESNQSQ